MGYPRKIKIQVLSKDGYWAFNYLDKIHVMPEDIECKVIDALIVGGNTLRAEAVLMHWKPELANEDFCRFFKDKHYPEYEFYRTDIKPNKSRIAFVYFIFVTILAAVAFLVFKACHRNTSHEAPLTEQDYRTSTEQDESLEYGDTIFINDKWAIYEGKREASISIETNEELHWGECQDLYNRYDIFKDAIIFLSLRNNSSPYLIYDGADFYYSVEAYRDKAGVTSTANDDALTSARESSSSSISNTSDYDTPIASSLSLMETIEKIAQKTKIVGVWANPPYNYVIFVKKGRYYMGAIEKGNTEILGDDPLRKKSSRLYVSTDAGDMPERYVIDSYGDLSVYVYNLEVNEWVDYGKYNQIY